MFVNQIDYVTVVIRMLHQITLRPILPEAEIPERFDLYCGTKLQSNLQMYEGKKLGNRVNVIQGTQNLVTGTAP